MCVTIVVGAPIKLFTEKLPSGWFFVGIEESLVIL